MATSVPVYVNNPPGQVGMKVQPSSASDGTYVPVVALDADTGITIGSVSQEGSWTVTANAGTDLDTSALALESGGNLATLAGTVAGGKVKVDASGVTLPVSAASLPLPANAAQEAGGNLATIAGTVSAGKVATTVSGSVAVTGTFFQATQPVSATSLPLPANAAQETGGNLATLAGTVSASKVQIAGTITANAGTNLNTSTLALESGGNLATLAGTVATGKVKVDPSGVTSPVSLASLPTLAAGTNAIGGTYAAPTASSSFGIAPGSSSALEASHVLKASAGNLYSLYVMTTSVGGYLMTFNATSAPADGAVTPVECIQILANSAAAISWDGAPPDYYSTGIVVVFSSTGPFTKTASATAFFKWRVR